MILKTHFDEFAPYLKDTSAKQQISGRLSILVWALLLASQDQTRHENAKSMNCAMLGIWLLMPLFKWNSNIYIG